MHFTRHKLISLNRKILMTKIKKNQMNRNDFMNFFRNTEQLNSLSVDDRIEIFSTILLGSSDFKKQLLEDIFSDYCVNHLEVVEISND